MHPLQSVYRDIPNMIGLGHGVDFKLDETGKKRPRTHISHSRTRISPSDVRALDVVQHQRLVTS